MNSLTNTLSTYLLVAIALTAFAPVKPAYGELALDVYINWMKSAEEQLEFEPVELRSLIVNSKQGRYIKVQADIRIKKVLRTTTGLVDNEVLRVAYRIYQYGTSYVGPSQPLHLNTGKTYMGFLGKSQYGDYYVPGAGGKSFMDMETFNRYYRKEVNPPIPLEKQEVELTDSGAADAKPTVTEP